MWVFQTVRVCHVQHGLTARLIRHRLSTKVGWLGVRPSSFCARRHGAVWVAIGRCLLWWWQVFLARLERAYGYHWFDLASVDRKLKIFSIFLRFWRLTDINTYVFLNYIFRQCLIWHRAGSRIGAQVETIIDHKFERYQFLRDVKNVGCRWPCDNVA